MIFIWILPISLLTSFMNRGLVQSAKALPAPDSAQSTAVFVPDPSAPPVITQGAGTR
jgi:hypothetical protein